MVAGIVLVGCAPSGPTTEAELCEAYQEVYTQMSSPISGVYGNPVFSAIGDLASVSARYEGDGQDVVHSGAERLKEIADSDETSVGEVAMATGPVATVCGLPGLGTFNN